jgi:hypothetical protein
LDDEFVVEIRIADFEILRTEQLGDPAKDPLAVDVKPETVRVDERRADPGVGGGRFPGGDGVRIQGDLPLAVRENNPVRPLEKSARLVLRPDLPAELGPNLFFAGAEYLPQDAHFVFTSFV